tara:strand:- start:1848 stop:2219 length:372 start_codon:yes stop_codon:yes gene_type:complete
MTTSINDSDFTCPRCQRETKNVGQRRGKDHRSYCRPCQKEYHSEWYQKNRARLLKKAKDRSQVILKWLNNYKLDKGCNKCGYDAHACALDFHHVVESNKSFALNEAQRRRYGINKIKKKSKNA